MYRFYIDGTLLPVAPKSLTTKIKNGNKTFTLIDTGEINILKNAKLTDFEFDCLLPNQKYPFAEYSGGYQDASTFIDVFERCKTSKEPFQFVVNRIKPNGTTMFDTNIKVSMEEYTILDEVTNGTDLTVKIKLKQYRDWGTKLYTVEDNGDATVEENRPESANSPEPAENTVESYTVKSGDTMWGIAKATYGDGAMCYKLATYNDMSNPNVLMVGDVVSLPSADVVNACEPTYGKYNATLTDKEKTEQAAATMSMERKYVKVRTDADETLKSYRGTTSGKF